MSQRLGDRRRRLELLLRKKAERSRSFPLSFSQQRLWLLDQLEPGDPLYNIPMAIRLDGPIDLDALNRTLNEVVARHETLRTRMGHGDDGPVQIIEPMRPREIAIVDLTQVPAEQREAELQARVNDEVRKPFRLEQSPLFRAVLLRLATTEHVLVVVLHHIISDDWSMGVLFREMALLYRAFALGQPSPLDKLPIQYADYAVWQRRQLQGERLQRSLEYWCQCLHDVAALELPTDRPHTTAIGNAGGTETIVLPSELAAQLPRGCPPRRCYALHDSAGGFPNPIAPL